MYTWTDNSMDYANEEGRHLANIGFSMIDANQTYVVEHTWVSEDARGMGLAGKITVNFLEHARAEGKKVLPLCPYTKNFFEKHPEYADLLKS